MEQFKMQEFNMVPSSEVQDDVVDLPEISPKTKEKVKKIWKIISLVISWVTMVLYIWDCVSSFLSYKFWMSKFPHPDFKHCLVAWLIFSIIGSVLGILLLYNNMIYTIRFFLINRKLYALSHQYSTFIAYYLHEIPKSVVFLTMMIKFSIIPDELIQLTATFFQVKFVLGQSNYYKIIIDALKMLGFFILGIIEFVHILKHDRKILFLVLNSAAAVCHLGLLVAITVFKIKIDLDN